MKSVSILYLLAVASAMSIRPRQFGGRFRGGGGFGDGVGFVDGNVPQNNDDAANIPQNDGTNGGNNNGNGNDNNNGAGNGNNNANNGGNNNGAGGNDDNGVDAGNGGDNNGAGNNNGADGGAADDTANDGGAADDATNGDGAADDTTDGGVDEGNADNNNGADGGAADGTTNDGGAADDTANGDGAADDTTDGGATDDTANGGTDQAANGQTVVFTEINGVPGNECLTFRNNGEIVDAACVNEAIDRQITPSAVNGNDALRVQRTFTAGFRPDLVDVEACVGFNGTHFRAEDCSAEGIELVTFSNGELRASGGACASGHDDLAQMTVDAAGNTCATYTTTNVQPAAA